MADLGSDTTTNETVDTEPTFDFNAAADTIGEGLGLGHEPAETESVEQPIASESGAEADAAAQAQPPLPTTPQVRPAPKTWPKDMHEHWGKLDPAVHDYLEKREKQMLDGLAQYQEYAKYGQAMHSIFKPYEANIRAAGLSEGQALQYLFHADHLLRNGSPQEKTAYFHKLAKDYGVDLGDTEHAAMEQAVDPRLLQLEKELYSIKSGLTSAQQAAQADARVKVTKEVDVFWSDTKAHPYADDVASDMVPFLQQGLSLQDAYAKAVWANDVTRAKEIARLQTEDRAKQQENARLAALPKKQAAGVNVKGRDTRRAPTEPLGGIEDTIKSTLADMKARA